MRHVTLYLGNARNDRNLQMLYKYSIDHTAPCYRRNMQPYAAYLSSCIPCVQVIIWIIKYCWRIFFVMYSVGLLILVPVGLRCTSLQCFCWHSVTLAISFQYYYPTVVSLSTILASYRRPIWCVMTVPSQYLVQFCLTHFYEHLCNVYHNLCNSQASDMLNARTYTSLYIEVSIDICIVLICFILREPSYRTASVFVKWLPYWCLATR